MVLSVYAGAQSEPSDWLFRSPATATSPPAELLTTASGETVLIYAQDQQTSIVCVDRYGKKRWQFTDEESLDDLSSMAVCLDADDHVIAVYACQLEGDTGLRCVRISPHGLATHSKNWKAASRVYNLQVSDAGVVLIGYFNPVDKQCEVGRIAAGFTGFIHQPITTNPGTAQMFESVLVTTQQQLFTLITTGYGESWLSQLGYTSLSPYFSNYLLGNERAIMAGDDRLLSFTNYYPAIPEIKKYGTDAMPEWKRILPVQDIEEEVQRMFTDDVNSIYAVTQTDDRAGIYKYSAAGELRWKTSLTTPVGSGLALLDAQTGLHGNTYYYLLCGSQNEGYSSYAVYLLDSNGYVINQFIEPADETIEFQKPDGDYYSKNLLDADTYGGIRIAGTQKIKGASTSTGFIRNLCMECTPNITGVVYSDVNRDCARQDETGIPGLLLRINDGTEYAFAGDSGRFSLIAPFGEYKLEIVSTNPYWSSYCPPSAFTLNEESQSQETSLAVHITTGVQDLKISMAHGPIRPGFITHYTLQFTNAGTISMEGRVTLHHNPYLNLLMTAPAVTASAADSLSWDFFGLLPLESRLIHFNMLCSSNTAVGTGFSHVAKVHPIPGDWVPADNTDTDSGLVTGSFDPNDKSVFPAGEGSEHRIGPPDSMLAYVIRFQNTGTDTAFTIVVRDTISPYLQLESLQAGVSSHPYTISAEPGNTIKWNFTNIFLPDSNTNEPASHGYLKFYIRPKQNLAPGTVIRNKAAIYFDFNEPVITNEVMNTWLPETPMNSIPILLEVFPNPFLNLVTFALNQDVKAHTSLELLDISGKAMIVLYDGMLDAGKHSFTWNSAADLVAPGLYLLQWNCNGRYQRVKLIKQ